MNRRVQILQIAAFVWMLAALQAVSGEPADAKGGTPRDEAIANPVEKDPRLHSDGKGWRLDKATVTDPTRPRVLLIGDSILNGYQSQAIKALNGKAYVDAWVNPYCQSENFNRLLAEVLEKNGPYAVVHINLGLHGWQKDRIKEGTYQPLTEGFINVIREKYPKARIIWASTTPARTKNKIGELDAEINPIVLEHNRLAAEVMARNKIPINDFYSLLVNKLDLARSDQFHWTNPAHEILANACAKLVLEELMEFSR